MVKSEIRDNQEKSPGNRKKPGNRESNLRKKIRDLEARLAESEETLRAIREGEVDAIVISGSRGEQVFSLFGAESIYRLIVETMTEAAFTVAFDGQILYCNAQFCRLVKRQMEQVLGHALQEFVAEDDRSAALSLLRSVQNEPVSRRLVFRSADNVTVPAHVSANMLYEPDEMSICVVASDLTELENSTELIQQLRRQQEALHESERQFRGTFMNAAVGITHADGKGKWLRVNEKFRQMVGLDCEELQGRCFLDFTHPDDRKADASQYAAMWIGVLDNYGIEKRYIGKDGREVWALVTRSLQRDENGRPLYSISVIQDIEDRKKAEAELQESRVRLQSILGSMTEGLIIFDRAGRLLEMNPAAMAMHGYDDITNLRGRLFPELNKTFEILDLQGKPLPAGLWPVARALKGETFTDFELRVRGTDGSKEWVASYGGAPVVDAEGRLQLAIVTLRDITSQKLMEESLLESQSRLVDDKTWLEERVVQKTAEVRRRADQLRELASQLVRAEQQERRRLAGILHDHLQQLLVAAKLNLSVVTNRVPDEQLRESLRQVNGLLDESLSASRSLTTELSPSVLYRGTFAAALRWLGDWMYEKHSLEVQVEADESVNPPSEEIRILLFQSVRELLFNVVKHAKTSRARVRLQQDEHQRIRIVVADDGSGFDTEQQRRSANGSGLGLFAVEERLETVGGSLEVDSSPGKGTRITILAPLSLSGEQNPVPDTMEEDALPGEAARKVAGTGSGIGKIRVLLADDHTVIRDGLRRLIATEPDMEVVGQASDGYEAVKLASELQPDVVVMDVSMPALDGIGATRQIISERPYTCVIGLSMHGDPAIEKKLTAAGARRYLTKSSPPDALVGAIRACTRGNVD